MSRLNFIISTAGLLLLDQAVKLWVRSSLSKTDYIEVIPNFIHLVWVQNAGISFNWLQDLPSPWRVLILVFGVVAIIGWLIFYVIQNWVQLGTADRWGFALILGGALGNLVDRVLLGSVTDYMFFHFYDFGLFVNNLADDWISIGFVILLWGMLFRKNT